MGKRGSSLEIKNNNMKKILVTGHKGYIGTHLVQILKEHGYFVTGCDLNLFDGCEWETSVKPDVELLKDVRDLKAADVAGHDCIMHLAAISNDPMGDLNEAITLSINYEGSVKLAELAKSVGVPRFLFSGSCSIYGKGETLDLDESAKLNPVSAYAISKIKAENDISRLASDEFCPVFLRNSTAYGYSPMLRIDLVVNNLLACALTKGQIRIMSDGTPWRPLIHCKDIARAFVAFLQADTKTVLNKAVNIGANSENFQVKDVADKVQQLLPKSQIVFTGEVGTDPRNYRVKFDLLGSLLPDFRLYYNLSSGMEELFEKFTKNKFSLADFEGDKYVRLRTLKKKISLIDKG
jgi:nucleoside-diphosphate-sugar epimerase